MVTRGRVLGERKQLHSWFGSPSFTKIKAGRSRLSPCYLRNGVEYRCSRRAPPLGHALLDLLVSLRLPSPRFRRPCLSRRVRAPSGRTRSRTTRYPTMNGFLVILPDVRVYLSTQGKWLCRFSYLLSIAQILYPRADPRFHPRRVRALARGRLRSEALAFSADSSLPFV